MTRIRRSDAMAKRRRAFDHLARRGDAFYEREIAPRIRPEDHGRFVAIDVESGACEIAPDEMTAIDRLLARNPRAQIWLRRIGRAYTHRLARFRLS